MYSQVLLFVEKLVYGLTRFNKDTIHFIVLSVQSFIQTYIHYNPYTSSSSLESCTYEFYIRTPDNQHHIQLNMYHLHEGNCLCRGSVHSFQCNQSRMNR